MTRLLSCCRFLFACLLTLGACAAPTPPSHGLFLKRPREIAFK
jgi:hypothetical protein